MELLKQAFKARPRKDFLPNDVQNMANNDHALPIGFGQTNSQPSLVFDMLQILEVKPGQKVLDVGCGSGWTTSLIGYLVGNKGNVFGTELVPELAEFAESNCNKFANKNINILNTRKTLGYPKKAPYDRILVSAASDYIPQELIDQLSSNNGKMVLPIKDRIVVVTKNDGDINIAEQPGYRVLFVPLIH